MRLSILVLAYDMQRELPRTLRSMVPPAQRGVGADDYRIVVIDNGSPAPCDLSGIDFQGVSVEIRRVAPAEASPSPVVALNAEAQRQAKTADALMFCIDGARLFSPYLVRRSIDALARAPRAFVYVGSRHLGAERQMVSALKGFDQQAEDRLLSTVPWEADLDSLNAISVWAGSHIHDTAFFQNESNAFTVSSDVWQRRGGFNEGFTRPGGGLCNLEVFSRFVTRPKGRNILLLGETTFHQFHGGAATANQAYFADSLAEYTSATGMPYALPKFNFEVDIGAAYNRENDIGRWYFR